MVRERSFGGLVFPIALALQSGCSADAVGGEQAATRPVDMTAEGLRRQPSVDDPGVVVTEPTTEPYPIIDNPRPTAYLPQPPLPGPIPDGAVASIACSTVDAPPQLPAGSIASLVQDNPWPGASVAYRFDASIPSMSTPYFSILQAIHHYHFMTPLRFEEDTNGAAQDYVLFSTTEHGCHTDGFGYGGGKRVVNLGDGCYSFGTVVHEMGHAVGLHHEQRRADRDDYILIQDGKVHGGIRTNSNIVSEKLDQFSVFTGTGYQVGGFDFNSVMLYPSVVSDTDFAKDTTKPIITRRDGSTYPVPGVNGLSLGDTSTLFQIYPPAPPGAVENFCQTAPPSKRRSTFPKTAIPKPSDMIAVSDSGGASAFANFPSTGMAFANSTPWGTVGGFQASTQWAAADFNGDGLTDIAGIQETLGMTRIIVRTSTGSALLMGPNWIADAGMFRSSNVWLPGDFNHDDVDDLIVVWNNGGRTAVTYLGSTGSQFVEPVHRNRDDGDWHPGAHWMVGDFNNDGWADLAEVWNDGGLNTVTVRANSYNGPTKTDWFTRQGPWRLGTRWLAGDFTGDGRADLAMVSPTNGGRVFVSTSNAFAGADDWTFADAWIDSGRWTVGDFNNDGLADLAAVANGAGTNVLVVRQSTGSSFTNDTWNTSGTTWIDSTHWCAGRFRSASDALDVVDKNL